MTVHEELEQRIAWLKQQSREEYLREHSKWLSEPASVIELLQCPDLATPRHERTGEQLLRIIKYRTGVGRDSKAA